MKFLIHNIILIVTSNVQSQFIYCEVKNSESLPDCKVKYDTIYQLETKAFNILDRKEISMSKRIRLSQSYASEGVELGYAAIQQGICKEYSIIIDRMLTLLNMLNRNEEGRVLALARLDIIYPGWKDYGYKGCVDKEHLRDLIQYTYRSEDNSFYDGIRERGGLTYGCGLEDIDYINEVRKLKYSLGDIYCFRYFQNSFNDINPINPKSYWSDYFDLIIECWTNFISIDELLSKYENSEIKTTGSNFMWYNNAKHYIEIDNTKLYFVPLVKNRYKSPEKDNLIYPDPHIMKDTSLFYTRLKWLAGKE